MLSKLKKSLLLKNSILYMIGSMMTPMIGFIMLPVYTGYLAPNEYGILTTIQTFVGLGQLLLLLSLHGAVTRFYYDYLDNKEEQKKYLGAIFLFVIIFATVISVILITFDQVIGNLIFTSIPINPYYYYMVGMSLLNAILALPLALLRAQEKATSFISINIIKALFIMLISIYLIIGKGLGVEGALLSQLTVTTFTVVVVLYKQRKFIHFNLNKNYIKQSLLFSLPLLPHVASGWIINSSDRIILERFVNLDQIGIYALAIQVSMVLNMFYTSLNNALAPRYFLLRKTGKVRKANRLVKVFIWVTIGSGVLSIPIAMYAVSVLSKDSYSDSIWLMPYLLVAQILNGLYFVPVKKLFYYKKTKTIATSSLIAAGFSIIVNIFLIPVIGIYGAVVSTVLAASVRLLLIYSKSKKLENLENLESLKS